jgi:hypothetical protein
MKKHGYTIIEVILVALILFISFLMVAGAWNAETRNPYEDINPFFNPGFAVHQS